MPNIATAFRDEIRRLARKEIKAAVGPLKKDNRRLKRQVAQLTREVTDLSRDAKRILPEVARLRQKTVDPNSREVRSARFGPKLIAALRRRLKLNREHFSLLVGVSANTIYLWEKDSTSPRPGARAKLLELRAIGVREARRRVAETPR